MSDDLIVSLGGITLEPHYAPAPASGWRMILTDLTGWRSRAQDSSESTEHWSGVGSVASSAKSGARQITCECLLVASSFAMLGSGLDAVSRLSRTTLTVAERDLARTADVRVLQPLDSLLSPTLAKVTLSLVADDPLRYSAETRLLVNGANLLPNRGDAAAFPRLSLTAPHDAISITHPGGVWTLPALPSGSRLIDVREGRVWSGNARLYGAGAGPMARVQPGGSPWTITGLGAGRALMTHGEAWS